MQDFFSGNTQCPDFITELFESQAANTIGRRMTYEGEDYTAPLKSNGSHLTVQFAKCLFACVEPDNGGVQLNRICDTTASALGKMFGTDNSTFINTVEQCVHDGNIHMTTKVKWELQPTFDPMMIMAHVLQQKVLRTAPKLSQPYNGGTSIGTIGTPNKGNKRSNTYAGLDSHEAHLSPVSQPNFGTDPTQEEEEQVFEWNLLDEERRTSWQKQHVELHDRKKALTTQITTLEASIRTTIEAAKAQKRAEEDLLRATQALAATTEKQKQTQEELEETVGTLVAEQEKQQQEAAQTAD
jgi:hypothetical protein